MSDKPQPPAGERLAKVIARAGVCSRRDAETWITGGRISVNGSPVKTPAFNVVESDTISVDGKPLARKQATQLWLYHKPAGLMVTEKDPEGRPTVFEALTQMGLPRVLTVGRLDFNTEGLLLLTNDGGLKRTLELPATGWVRRYRVRAFGSVTQEQLDKLAHGITVEGVEYGPIEAVLDSASGSNIWITVGLREGKNREVRNVLGALGLEVNRLIRTSYGPFQLGELPSGAVEKVKTRILRDQLGKRLADTAGADFDSPIDDEEGQPRRRMPQKAESRPTERDRFGGLRKRPDFNRPERREEAPRTVHFDDGRPPQTYVPVGDPKARRGDFKRDEKPGARDGGFKRRSDDASGRPRRDGDKPFGKGPRKGGDRPFGDRPPRRDGDRPFAKGPRRDDARPARRDDDKAFSRGPRRDQPASADRPFRKDADRPFAKRSGPRPDRPARDGDRPSRPAGDRPYGKGPRRDDGQGRPTGPRPQRREGSPADRPRGDRKFDGARNGKPGGRPAGKPGARPRAGAPRPPRKPKSE